MNNIINSILTSGELRTDTNVENMLLTQAVATPWVN